MVVCPCTQRSTDGAPPLTTIKAGAPSPPATPGTRTPWSPGRSSRQPKLPHEGSLPAGRLLGDGPHFCQRFATEVGSLSATFTTPLGSLEYLDMCVVPMREHAAKIAL